MERKKAKLAIILRMSDKLGTNENNRTKAMFGTRNQDYVRGAAC